MTEGVIIRGRGGLYTVTDAEGCEYVLRAKKKFRHQGISPLVGDNVLFTPGGISDEHGWVEEILPRKSCFLRPPVANVTVFGIVIAPSPEPDWLLADKLLYQAVRQKLTPLIVINKTELDGGDATVRKARDDYRGTGTVIYPVSALENRGLEALRDRLRGETACFSGQSGVGKSTLMNTLYGVEAETGDISERIRRGRNTTRHTELFARDGARVIDTPGFSLLEMDEVMDPVTLQRFYPDFTPYEGQCRFVPCCHAKEPGCAVLKAVQQGEISRDRMERYHILLEECREKWRNRYD